eukprot:6654439-Prymnesium_polylepis.1
MSGYAQQPGTERLALAKARVLFKLFRSEPNVGRASPLLRYVWKGHQSSPSASRDGAFAPGLSPSPSWQFSIIMDRPFQLRATLEWLKSSAQSAMSR